MGFGLAGERLGAVGTSLFWGVDGCLGGLTGRFGKGGILHFKRLVQKRSSCCGEGEEQEDDDGQKNGDREVRSVAEIAQSVHNNDTVAGICGRSLRPLPGTVRLLLERVRGGGLCWS